MIFNLFLTSVVFFFAVRTLRNTLYQLYLWQLKEYRLDRMWSYLKTSQGRKLLFSPPSSLKWLFFLVIYGLSLVNIYLLSIPGSYVFIIYAFYAFYILWFLESLLFLRDLIFGRLRLAKFTIKASLIFLIVLTIEFSPLYFVFWMVPLVLGPLLDKLLGPLIFLTVVMINLPSTVYKKYIIRMARQKIKSNKDLVVIGITGSFGKTTTKEFLFTLLSGKYKTSKTPKSYNTEYSVARYILNNLPSDCRYLIVEMGAYRRGEIAAICRLVNPKIAVITGIGSQHLELFGSLENLIRAKSELVDFLKRGDLVVVNNRSLPARQIANRARSYGKKILLTDSLKQIKNIQVHKTRLDFTVKLKSRFFKARIKLAGEKSLDNLLLASTTALACGLSEKEIKKEFSQIKAPEKTMAVISSSSKLTMIDDTFNVNLEAALAALDYLKIYKGIKVFVLNPLIELGENASSFHRLIGGRAASICQYLLVTNMNYFSDLKAGSEKSHKKNFTIRPVGKDIIRKIIKELKSDSAVVFEGKEAAKFIPFFKN